MLDEFKVWLNPMTRTVRDFKVTLVIGNLLLNIQFVIGWTLKLLAKKRISILFDAVSNVERECLDRGSWINRS